MGIRNVYFWEGLHLTREAAIKAIMYLTFSMQAAKKVLFIDTNGSWNASLGTGLSSASNDATITNWSNNYSTNKTTYTDIIANAKDYSSADYDSTNSFLRLPKHSALSDCLRLIPELR